MRIIGDLMQRAYPDLMAINKRQLIPILGITGSGKSTLFNYLLGCKYKWGIETGQISLTPKPIDVSKRRLKRGQAKNLKPCGPYFQKSTLIVAIITIINISVIFPVFQVRELKRRADF
ncbi:MAG: ATP-binding cassette domain-containing protein [Coxiellaceae bacterium]|nr:MAG: ATP-binding cassette domain-containing protein [Coxiellaceae bacterium]